jgi:hypothetical protein
MYSDTVIKDEIPTLLKIIAPHIKAPLIAWHTEAILSGISTRILLIYSDLLYAGCISRMEAFITKEGEVFSYSFLNEIVPLLKTWVLQIGEKYRQINRTDNFKRELIGKRFRDECSPDEFRFDS